MGAAGVASTTRSAVSTSGATVGPTTSSKPSEVRRSSRTPASVRTVKPPSLASASVSAAIPPARPAKTGTSEAGGTVAAARTSDGSRSSSATTCGTVARTDSARACPAYTPPSSGSTSRSTTSSPSRSATNAATETSSSGAGAVTSARARAMPPSESTPVRASSSRSAGTPITERGSGRSAPRVQMREEMVAGWTRSRPSERARSTASGRRLSIASAPTSTVTPATSARRSLPPTDGRALEHQHVVTGRCELVGGGQPGDAGPHDDGTALGHAASLPDRSGNHPGPGCVPPP